MSRRLSPDGLPKPKAFLLAGIARPNAALGTRVGTVEDMVPFLNSDESWTRGSLTILDDSGQILGVVYARTNMYLVSPSTHQMFGASASDVVFESSGFISYFANGRWGTTHEGPYPEGTIPGARPSTLDLSVAIAGPDKSKFDKSHLLFWSASLQLDLAVLLGRELRGDQLAKFYAFRGWHRPPVPVDPIVIQIFRDLVQEVRPTLFDGSPLSRTDLLCAATAIAYESPMYTTHPEDYAGLGVRVIEYGPVRNKTAAKEQEAERQRAAERLAARKEAAAQQPLTAPAQPSGPQPPYLDPSSQAADRAFRALFRTHEPFGDEAIAALRKAAKVGNDLTGAIADILDDADGDDTSWRLGLLEMAPEYDRALNPKSVYRGNLVIAAGNILNTVHGTDAESLRMRDLAFAAQAAWGRWPDDASFDMLIDFETDPIDENALAYYRSYMLMAGISAEVADRELDEVRAGRAQPTRERIEELRAG